MYAKNNSMSTIALLGFDGGKLLSLVDHAILVKSDIGMYGPVEDIQLSICHAISADLDLRLRYSEKVNYRKFRVHWFSLR